MGKTIIKRNDEKRNDLSKKVIFKEYLNFTYSENEEDNILQLKAIILDLYKLSLLDNYESIDFSIDKSKLYLLYNYNNIKRDGELNDDFKIIWELSCIDDNNKVFNLLNFDDTSEKFLKFYEVNTDLFDNISGLDGYNFIRLDNQTCESRFEQFKQDLHKYRVKMKELNKKALNK